MKGLIVLISALIPWRIRVLLLNLIPGFQISSRARIGFTFLSAERVELQAGTSIGSFTVVRNLPSLILGRDASIGSWNWITSISLDPTIFKSTPDRAPSLILGNETSITSRHYIDVQDRVHLDDYVTLAGVRTSIFTHGIDVVSNSQIAAPVSIGKYSYIGSNSVILAGSCFPAKSVLAAGAVYNQVTDISGMYAGVPAKLKKTFAENAKHFCRLKGSVE